MTQPTIYISGEISGVEGFRDKFNDAEQRLAALGFRVVNPINNSLPGYAPWQAQMRADIKMLMDCTHIFMLENWERSLGATLEHDIAVGMGFQIIYERTPKHKGIKVAIAAGMGVTFKTITEDSRNRWHVYARMIYAHHCKKNGETTQGIAEDTQHDPSTISYYLRRYDNEYKYNREFRAAATKVATLLS